MNNRGYLKVKKAKDECKDLDFCNEGFLHK